MSRGFGMGLLWGGVVSVIGLAGLSEFGPDPLPSRRLPQASPRIVTDGTVTAGTVTDSTVTDSTVTAANAAGEAAALPQPGPSDAAPVVAAPPAQVSAAITPTEIARQAFAAPPGQMPDHAGDEPLPAMVELLPPPPLTPEEQALVSPYSPEAQLSQAGTKASASSLPLLQYARPFRNPEHRPLMAILLRDTGLSAQERAEIAALPFAISFILDPAAVDASEAEAAYRAAGQEVIMLASGLPHGASAEDLAQRFRANAERVKQAVAVADLEHGGFQEDRALAAMTVPVIGGQGRGLVTFERGANAADQIARQAHIPSARIYRRLDADGEGPAMIGRALDRAAYRAIQDGRVVVLGETRADTLRVLQDWVASQGAARLALAPLTAVLSSE